MGARSGSAPDVVDQALAPTGRALLAGYATDAGTVGTPADSLRALRVGAVDAAGLTQPYSAEGPPLGAELECKPDLRSPDRLGLEGAKNVGGTGLSAAFSAGRAAVLLGGGATPERVREELRPRPAPMPRAPKE